MKRLPQKKETTILIILVAIIILFSYYYFFFRPRAKVIGKLIPQVVKIKHEIRTAESEMANSNNLKRKINTLEKKVNYYEESLPSEKEIPALLKNLSKLASESGVKITAIQPLDITRSKDKNLSEKSSVYIEVPVAITAECSYHQLGSFINKLETSPRFMKVTNIEIKGNSVIPTKHNAKLLISTFVLEWQ